MHISPLPYFVDGAELFARLADLPEAVYLDSAHPYSLAGRFDIMAAQPVDVGIDSRCSGRRDLLSWLSKWELWLHAQRPPSPAPAANDWPFCGGVIGYLEYDAGLSLHGLSLDERRLNDTVAQLNYYAWAVVQDHQLQRAALICTAQVSGMQRRQLLERLQSPGKSAGSFTLTRGFQPSNDFAIYRERFDRVQSYLHAGDCYQVNLAEHYSAEYTGDPWVAYQRLRQLAAGPMSAYLEHGAGAILSVSPERFVSVRDFAVETRPIKGTRPRHADPARDQAAVEELRGAEKDRAENLMIVDLLRNDLGRVCELGTVRVDQLFAIESYAQVHHMVSVIRGRRRADVGPLSLLGSCFPGGSITGAPKRRAMEIIAELERHARRIYCGSVFYLDIFGRLDSSIAIRSLLAEQGRLQCWGGGGLVADSRAEDEYQEIADKVGGIMAGLRIFEAQ